MNQRRGCLHINWRGEADIIKRRLLALVLATLNPAKFTHAQSKVSNRRPLVCIYPVFIRTSTYQRGRSLFILVCRVLQEPKVEE